jgi:hypothetical protein
VKTHQSSTFSLFVSSLENSLHVGTQLIVLKARDLPSMRPALGPEAEELEDLKISDNHRISARHLAGSSLEVLMASKLALRLFLRASKGQFQPTQIHRCFSISARLSESPTQPSNHERTTHFGFETVAEAEKEARGTNYPLVYMD